MIMMILCCVFFWCCCRNFYFFFFFSSRRRHTRWNCDWSSDVCSSDLNPHAGEGGALGKEDDEIVRPAVEALQKLGIAATGPWAPDSMFHADARAGYDAALCMYHDQRSEERRVGKECRSRWTPYH